MARRNYVAKVGWVGAAVLLAAGVITIIVGLFTPMGIASFGWFAYQPLANATFTPGGSAVVLSPVTVAGWVLLAVGLITLAFLVGRFAGQRSHE
jgi:heme/copper-type cytochrome/quinol oxidase subunit 1